MADTSNGDRFCAFPPIPTTPGPTVLWDSGPDPAGIVGVQGLRPLAEISTTRAVALALMTDQAWTLVVQELQSDGEWATVNHDAESGDPGGQPVEADEVWAGIVPVAGGGRRRVAALFEVAPTTWVTGESIRLMT